MATEAARSSGAADSYIGSLISLTSKFEIRYEGILYNINTEESTIGLKNVRSFGTEGRKKDGPQIPPSDKVYDYILFRGSDIKDLQVKSSPPAQTPPVHSDPAIIQSHYSQPPPPVPTSVPPFESGPAADLVSHTALGLPANPNLHPSQAAPPASAPPVGSGTAPDLASHAAPSLPRSTYQGGLPLYTSSVNLGSWGASPGMPMPNANGAGVAVPPGYWQGYYVPPSGLAPHIQQFRPQPPGLPMHHPLQQPLHYASMNTGLPTNAPYLSEFSSPLLPPISLASTTGGIYPGSASAPLTSALGPTQASALASETSTAATTNQAPITSPNLGLNNSLMPSSYDAKNTSAPVSDKSQALPHTTFRPQTLSHSLSASVVSAPITRTETLVVPFLATPGQLLQPGPNTLTSSKAEPVENKDVEAMPTVSSEQSLLGAGDHQAPILPLPTPYGNKVDGSAAPPMRNSYRGRERGRGSGISRDGTKFTEEFDFSAMNERFNKDEVWGELGKSKGYADEDKDLDKEVDYSKQDNKPVYVKDDFFDTLSCNSLDCGNRNGWTRFSEQMKLDTETFGNFPRRRGNRGGRGPPRGGRGRGSYYGRGYGYVGRGRS